VLLTQVVLLTWQVSSIVDIVSFLKCIGLLPKVLSIEEVPEIFSAVINASPVHKVEINQASVSVSQVLDKCLFITNGCSLYKSMLNVPFANECSLHVSHVPFANDRCLCE
jgi:hypothetical protein